MRVSRKFFKFLDGANFFLDGIKVVMVVIILIVTGWTWYSQSAYRSGISLMQQGNQLLQTGDMASIRRAIPLYQQAATMLHGSDQKLNEGRCYHNIGQAHRQLHENPAALTAYRRALAIYALDTKPADAQKIEKERADILQTIGMIHDPDGQAAQAATASQ